MDLVAPMACVPIFGENNRFFKIRFVIKLVNSSEFSKVFWIDLLFNSKIFPDLQRFLVMCIDNLCMLLRAKMNKSNCFTFFG